MKKYISLFVLFTLLLVACDEQDFLVTDTFIKFNQPDSAASEADAAAGNSTVLIPISVSADSRTSALTVEVSVSGDAISGVHYNMLSSTILTIPANQYSVDIELDILNNNLTDGSHDLVFEIVNNSEGLDIGFPGPDALNAVHTLTIGDDDCAFDISIFEGTYDVNEDNGAFVYTAEVSITGTNTINVTNFWGSGLTAEVTLDASDPNNLIAYILPQDGGAELCCGANSWVTSRADPNALAPVDVSLPDGSFTTCDGGFDIDYYVYIPGAGTFNGRQPINAVYTRQ